MSLLLVLRGSSGATVNRTVAQTLGSVSESVTVQTVFSHTETYYEDPAGGINKTLTVPLASWQAGDLVLVNVGAQGSVDYDFRVTDVRATGLTFTQAASTPGHPTSEVWQARAATTGAASVTIWTQRQADDYEVTVLAVRHATKPVYLDTASITYSDGADNQPTVSITPTDAIGRLFTFFSVVSEATLVLDPGTAAPNALRLNDASGLLITSAAYGDHVTGGVKTTDASLTGANDWTALSFFVSTVQHLSLTAADSVTPITELPVDAPPRTRFYLPSGGLAAVNPAFSTWTETTNADRLRTVVSKSGTVFVNKAQSHLATAANSTFLSRMYVSDPLRAQTIPVSTVKGTVRVLESAINDNLNAMRLTIRVVNNAGTTFRSPNLYGPVNGTVLEFNTVLQAKRLAVGGATASVTASAGDRIVIEIGTTNTVVGASMSDTINYGDSGAADLGDNETDTSISAPFVEIATPITFSQNPVRSVGATIGTLTELPGKVAGHLRTVAQAVGAFTSGLVVAIPGVAPPTYSRNADQNDALATLVEGVSRSAGLHQTTSATIATLTETPSQTKILPRSVSAALATLTESVAAGGFQYIRTALASLIGFIWGDTPWGASTYGSGTGIAESIIRVIGGTGARAVADSIAAISETVTRLETLGRSVATTLGSVSEAVARLVTEARSLSDSIATISEAPLRLVTTVRTAADSIATLTESVVRGVIAFARTVAQSVGSISEAVVGVKSGINNLVRIVADTMGAIGEAANRGTSSFGRSASDALATLTETVVRDALAKLRSVADTVATISETVSRGAANFIRAVADSASTLTEAITGQLKVANRAVAQSLGSISETVARGVAAFVRITQDTVGAISEAVVKNPGAAVIRSAAQSLGAIVESIANGAQAVGGIPPVIGSALHAVARGLGHSPIPKGSGHNPKPRK